MPSRPDDADSGVDALSERELYRIVHDATQDAILGVIGTVLWVGIGLVLALVGVQLAWGALSPVVALVGGVIAVGGLAIVARNLGLVPPVRELF